MLDRQHVFSQCVAVFLILFGSACMVVASKYDWAELKTAGAGIIGAGIQAVTSGIKQTLENKAGAVVNVNEPAEQH